MTLGDDAVRVIEAVAIGHGTDGDVLACAGCGQVLAPSDGNYRMGAAELDIDMTAISPLFVAPHRETGEDLVLRRCLCPGCGNLLDTYVCRPDELPFADVTVGKPRD